MTSSSQNGRQLYIPEGFAHGYMVTSDCAKFFLKVQIIIFNSSRLSLYDNVGTIVGGYDDLDLIVKKIVYLLGAKLRDKDKLKSAIAKQDKIKKRHSRNRKWNSVT